MSKSHHIEEVSELPLVVKNKVESYKKTKEAVLLLKKLRACNDIKKVYASQWMRAGKGKMRNHVVSSSRDPESSIMKPLASSRPSEASLELLCLL
jgi:large subunit ribosomal protein L4e